ncbi:hypothetical protein QQF64_006495 [Cirrhinus molitorella]|uniref:Uncharacterized protein n=1 Tax=Cirrhinus molitorella TaxID=172907 RepID=A0ABR3MHE5_9TELE
MCPSTLCSSLYRPLQQHKIKPSEGFSLPLCIESISSVPNVTVGYYVTRGELVYAASVVVEALNIYGIERLMADIRSLCRWCMRFPSQRSHGDPALPSL